MVNGKKYYFKECKYLKYHLPKFRAFERDYLLSVNKTQPGAFAYVTQRVISPYHGYWAIKRDVELIRGIIEFSSGCYSFTWHLGGRVKSATHIGHHTWMYCGSRKDSESNNDGSIVGFDIGQIEQRNCDIDSSKNKLLPILFRIFRRKISNSSYIEILADAMRLYALSQDQTEIDRRFLILWQIAERITLGESVGGETGKIADRVMKISPGIEKELPSIKLILVSLGKKRNRIVHNGESEIIDEDELYVFKRIIDVAVLTMINKTKDFKDEISWDLYLRHVGRSTAELQKIQAITAGLLNAKFD